jgi:hypothetical protein
MQQQPQQEQQGPNVNNGPQMPMSTGSVGNLARHVEVNHFSDCSSSVTNRVMSQHVFENSCKGKTCLRNVMQRAISFVFL